MSDNQVGTIYEQQVAQELACGDADKTDDRIGSHQTQHDGDGRAEYGQEGKESHPCTVAGHESLCLVKVFLFHILVFLNPVEPSHPTYGIVEYRTEHIAYGAIYNEGTVVQSRSHEGYHYSLAAEREETASKKGRQQHAPIAIAGQEIDKGIHRFTMVRMSALIVSTQNMILVARVCVSARKWAMSGLVLMMRMQSNGSMC